MYNRGGLPSIGLTFYSCVGDGRVVGIGATKALGLDSDDQQESVGWIGMPFENEFVVHLASSSYGTYAVTLPRTFASQ